MSYRRGNIVRIFMKDFLTFDEIEIRPTPYLNIVIGPNGNGKSTILCGICLGLAGKPVNTGRGKDATEYIKHDKQSATIEVELFVDGASQNIVVRRSFNRKNQNSWYLQGKTVKPAEVAEAVKELGIDINNLCQFLPQDRVADFAKLDKIQLLENTEKSIGDGDMFKQHEHLKENGMKFHRLKESLEDLQHQHDLEVNKNARIRDQVENYQVKEQIKEEIVELEKRREYWYYGELRAHTLRLKKERSEVKQQVLELTKKRQPLETKISEAKSEMTKLKSKNQEMEKGALACQREVEKYDRKHENFIESIDLDKQKFQRLKIAEANRDKEIRQLKDQLHTLNEQMSQLPDVDIVQLKKKLESITFQIQNITQNIQSNEKEIDDLKGEIRSCESQLNHLKHERDQIQNITNRRIEQLNLTNKHAYQAVKWLKNNRANFRAPIHDPICTQINLRDQAFAKYVEDRIARRDHFLFVCEDKRDVQEFKREMDKQRLQVNIAYSAPEDMAAFRPPITIEQLHRQGFRHFQCNMIDVIEAPPAIMTFLCKNYGIHRIPIALTGQYSDNLPNKLTLLYIGDSRYSRMQSKYDGEWSTSIVSVQAARFLSMTIDKERLNTLENYINQHSSNIGAHKEKINDLSSEQEEYQLNREKLKGEKRNLLESQDKQKQLRIRIGQKEKAIQAKENECIDLKSEEILMKDNIKNNIENIYKNIATKNKHFDRFISIKKQHTVLVLRGITYRSNIKEWEEELSTSKDQCQDLMALYSEKQKLVDNKSKEAHEVLKRLEKMLNVKSVAELTEEAKLKEFQETGPQSLAETERQLENLRARQACLMTADDNVVEEYRKREKIIAQMAASLEEAAESVAADNDALIEARDQWIPKITQLTEEISENFANYMAQLGCAGEVCLEHDENFNDYSKYGLQIRVRFRGTDQLRELNAQHQSGGERSVSTALYLLALQKLRPVPFRCIDEINQGMDPENERRMFKMLMESFKDDTASQCFLITPKLLPDLEYNRFVNVMTVYNSMHIIPHRNMRYNKIIKIRKYLNNKG